MKGNTRINAIIGAVVTVVLSFTGFSPILGGGLAAYLQGGDRREGMRIGALSGAIAAIPFILLFVLFGGFIFTGSFLGDGSLGIPGAAALIFVFGALFALIWTIGLSAVGGYLGAYVAAETDLEPTSSAR